MVDTKNYRFMRKPGTKVGPLNVRTVANWCPVFLKIDLFVRALIASRMILCENRAPSNAWFFSINGRRCWVRANVPVADQHDNTHKEQ